ncbi:peroxiredoxin [Marinicella rhabdoformis]|uniref:peroxiredoxin n=1 Tax=Marinicella rhabdoformis TaxID=2580566 RepID=UPI0012AED0C7|nr:peroxiredoxin [Marinicella rhabdoformis]
MVKIDKKVWQYAHKSTNESDLILNELSHKYVVLFFYPRANTPGCTKESVAFGEQIEAFNQADCAVYGISADSLKKQQNFKAKYDMPIDLIADTEEVLCHAFDVIQEKNMYGKKFMGIVRSTFVLNQKGEVLAEWRKVKVPGHVKEVLQSVTNL